MGFHRPEYWSGLSFPSPLTRITINQKQYGVLGGFPEMNATNKDQKDAEAVSLTTSPFDLPILSLPKTDGSW